MKNKDKERKEERIYLKEIKIKNESNKKRRGRKENKGKIRNKIKSLKGREKYICNG